VDAASPTLLSTFQRREALREVTLDSLKTDANSKEYVYQSVKLTNATVVTAIHSAAIAGPTKRGEQVLIAYERVETVQKPGPSPSTKPGQKSGRDIQTKKINKST
jgi:type VI protein secretion system component Hcp